MSDTDIKTIRTSASSNQYADHVFEPHDHAACVSQTVAAAEAKCTHDRARLTETRRKVLDFLLEEHRPLGAYAILDKLGDGGQRAQPPVAYRALDFLIENGLAHRIESLNAYVACRNPSQCAAPTFLICQHCNLVAESFAEQHPSPLRAAADEMGFVIERELREVSGTCPTCHKAAA